MDEEIEPQQYVVNDIYRVSSYISDVINVDFEATASCDGCKDGSITVFELTYRDHLMLRDFISSNNLWSKII